MTSPSDGAGGAGASGYEMSLAPKDRPILAWCNHEADTFFEGVPDDRGRLTLYAAHAEGLSHAPSGFHIIEWGGAFDDSTYEYAGAHLLDWWFVAGSEFEVAANPVLWWPLPTSVASRPSPQPSAGPADAGVRS